MKVQTRLLLFAVVAPIVALVGSALAAGQLFELSLRRAVDRELLSRAAVESVSLFDGPRGEPHVHLSKSPLASQVRPFEPYSALFGPDGTRVAESPPQSTQIALPDKSELPDGFDVPRLRTRSAPDGHDHRELLVRVRSDDGSPYILGLGSSLADVDATMRLYYQATLSICAGLALLLSILSIWQARGISSRLGRMASQLPRLEEGRFDWVLPPDHGKDEIAALARAFEEAFARLRTARDAEERFIANAAHELRTPLGVMRTEMDLALRRERSPEELRRALTEARDEVDRLAALASKLLDLKAARGISFAPRPCDLSSVIRDAVEAASRDAQSREVQLVCEVPTSLSARVDPEAIRQAVDNLLTNALKVAPEGSAIRVALTDDDTTLTLSVEDEGPGVSDDERDRVFEPFFRGGTAKGAGAGLGLAIVREIAARHGGRVALDGASRDAGARFVFELPRSVAEPSTGEV